MNPCKYEIPSGSTYGFLIADDAAQAWPRAAARRRVQRRRRPIWRACAFMRFEIQIERGGERETETERERDGGRDCADRRRRGQVEEVSRHGFSEPEEDRDDDDEEGEVVPVRWPQAGPRSSQLAAA